MTLPLSVLDLSPVDSGVSSAQALHNTTELAQVVERLGYTRIWLAEHHNTTMTASPAPEIMIAHVANATRTLHVGSGGVMLPNHSPLKVAENFRVLAALHPDRINLGLGRAPGTDPRTALALRRTREALNADNFSEQLAELLTYAGEMDNATLSPQSRSVQATPTDVPLPPIWLLGSSDHSARVAASFGLGFSFAHHINPAYALPAISLYRDTFVPSNRLQKSHVILTTGVIVADSDEEAESLASSMALAWLRLRTGHAGPLPSPDEARAYPYTTMDKMIIEDVRARQIVGRPEKVKQTLLNLVAETGADELMLSAMVYGHANRVRAFQLLAEAFSLSPAPVLS